jgi:hypothetical protein
MELIAYKQIKESKEYEASMIDLIRSKKQVKRPNLPVVSQGLGKLKNKI